MKYYIIAGERSGDLHASNLIRSLKEEDTMAEFVGVGGDYMKNEGATLHMNYRDISFMGFAEVLQNLAKISKALKTCKKNIEDARPDVLILIDFAGFNLRMAKFAKEKGIKVYYYISPKIWAWKQSRAYKIKALVDQMFVIMPFEKDFYAKFGYTKVDYIGNPLLDAVTTFKPDSNFRSKAGVSDKIVAVLPGSRRQEIREMIKRLPVIAAMLPGHTFLVAGVSNVEANIYAPLKGIENIRLFTDQTYNILSVAESAVVTSGTATLETALFKVPQAVVYKASFFTYYIAKWLIKVPYISLVNLIAGKKVVNELIQKDFNPKTVVAEIQSLSEGGNRRNEVMKDYEELRILLGEPGASKKAAKLMREYLSK
jgi:lipid-A-disaccharide synthase